MKRRRERDGLLEPSGMLKLRRKTKWGMVQQAEIWSMMSSNNLEIKICKYQKFYKNKKLIHLVPARNKFTRETH